MIEENPPAALTPSRLIAFKRLAEHPDFPVFWQFMQANFPLDESVFVITRSGRMDYLDACKRDGQRDVMLLIRKMLDMPTPAISEDSEL